MARESWQEGELAGVSKFLQPAAHALIQAERDLETAATALTWEEVWLKPNDAAPSVGFHLQHIAGSIDRLLTYTRGDVLNAAQFEFLAAETKTSGKFSNAAELTAEAVRAIAVALETIRETPDETLFEPRFVGREKLPTTVFGLLFHIAEHTMRHTGQVVTTAKIVSSRVNQK
jgi:uncharacterized damage-inducible protein DinB